MKYFYSNILFVIVLLNLFQEKVFAQSPYTPFPEGEAVWHVAYDQPDYGVGKRHDQYSYAGDTTMNGINWHRLSYKSELVPPGGNSHDYGIIGYVGQDSILKKVYYMPANDSVGHLLYDFDLQLGSLYPETFTHIVGDSTYVTKIDSILIGSTFRRIFIFGAGLDTVKLIEGIGANSGLLSPVYSGYCFENCWWLTCFQQNGEAVYTRFSYPNFCNLVSVSDLNQNQLSYNLKPNPIERGKELTLENYSGGQIQIALTDLSGRIIWQKKSDHESQLKIPTANLERGIYLVGVLTNSYFISAQKLVVQ